MQLKLGRWGSKYLINVDKKEKELIMVVLNLIIYHIFSSANSLWFVAKSYGRASRRCHTRFAASRGGTTDGWSSGSSSGWWRWRSSESVHDALGREPPQWNERNVQLLWDGWDIQPCGSDGKEFCNKVRERKKSNIE